MSTQEILMILGPIVGLLGWAYLIIDKRLDTIDARFDKIDQKFDQVLSEIKEMRKDIQSLDSRISRIEGQLSPHYWEPKVKGDPK